jgi:hypothetical protein
MSTRHPPPATTVSAFVVLSGYSFIAVQTAPAKAPSADLAGMFTFPFFTIENVAMVDAEHILVANDNTLLLRIGRYADRAADNGFIQLRVPELLLHDANAALAEGEAMDLAHGAPLRPSCTVQVADIQMSS